MTDGMDAKSGIFTVKFPGIYHFSFTGLFYAMNGHGINAHIKRQRGNSVITLGTSKADTNENGIGMLNGFCFLRLLSRCML